MSKVKRNDAGVDVPPQMPNIPYGGDGNGENLSAIETIALAKGGAKELTDAVRDSVGAGKYSVDCLLRMQGSVSVGEPYTQQVVAEIPWMALAYHLAQEVSAIALHRSIDRAMGEDNSKVKNFKSDCENTVTALKGKTERVVRGKVTTILTFTKV